MEMNSLTSWVRWAQGVGWAERVGFVLPNSLSVAGLGRVWQVLAGECTRREGGVGVEDGCAAVIYGTGEVARGARVKCSRFSGSGSFAGVFGENIFGESGFLVWGVLRAGLVGCATVHMSAEGVFRNGVLA